MGQTMPAAGIFPGSAVGPGVKSGYDLTRLESLEVRTEDSAATILYLLGLPIPPYLDGKPVVAIFNQETY